ncbi:MAG: adenine phosphoribosyltransferase [Planctomycetaceae bacterium]
MNADIDLKDYIRSIPDFPKPGILFRDITPLLSAPAAFRKVIQTFADHFRDRNVNSIIAAEARGFIFAAPLALELNARFIPVRKPGKLPFKKRSLQYDLEYGTDCLEMHADALTSDDRVLLVDDLLATGGTMEACLRMAEETGATIVGSAFVVELGFLNGRKRLAPHEVYSLIVYDGEN